MAQARVELMARMQRFLDEVPPHIRKQAQFHMRSFQDLRTGDFRLGSWTLLAAVLAMMLIACANAANLLLARAMTRRQELAIRVAVGAGTARMARQTLTEALLLSLAGGLAGWLLAAMLLRMFIAIAPEGIPHLASASLDARVLVFAIAMSLFCGVAFGVAPAFHTPKAEILSGARVTGRAGMARVSWWERSWQSQ
jgi:ABC-type antimicrobial peptide transport system permease subunit